MSRKEPTPPPKGIVKPPGPPGPPPRLVSGSKYFKESNPLIVSTLVYLQFGRQGILDMITAVRDHDKTWLKILLDDGADKTGGKD